MFWTVVLINRSRQTLLTEPAELVLKSNIFEFDEKTYKQMHGTAISTKFASPYAILFLAAIEEKF